MDGAGTALGPNRLEGAGTRAEGIRPIDVAIRRICEVLRSGWSRDGFALPTQNGVDSCQLVEALESLSLRLASRAANPS